MGKHCPYFMCGDQMKNVIYIQNYIRTHKAEALYNKVSNVLWTEFNIKSAEISLLATYVVLKIKEKEGVQNGKF